MTRISGGAHPSELDDRNEKARYRIRYAQVRRSRTLSWRPSPEAPPASGPRGEDLGALPLERVLEDLRAEIGSRSATLNVGQTT